VSRSIISNNGQFYLANSVPLSKDAIVFDIGASCSPGNPPWCRGCKPPAKLTPVYDCAGNFVGWTCLNGHGPMRLGQAPAQPVIPLSVSATLQGNVINLSIVLPR
jgi:hypothetical protein